MHTTPHGGRGVTLPKDVARWEANHSDNERQHARKQRNRRSAIQTVVRMRGEETPFEPESLGDDNEKEDEDKEEGK
jgi:hypothetical protein